MFHNVKDKGPQRKANIFFGSGIIWSEIAPFVLHLLDIGSNERVQEPHNEPVKLNHIDDSTYQMNIGH